MQINIISFDFTFSEKLFVEPEQKGVAHCVYFQSSMRIVLKYDFL